MRLASLAGVIVDEHVAAGTTIRYDQRMVPGIPPSGVIIHAGIFSMAGRFEKRLAPDVSRLGLGLD